MKTWDDYWKEIKPAECDEFKEYFCECWYTSQSEQYKKDNVVIDDLLAALENAANVLAGIATGDLKTIGKDSPTLLQARAAIARARGLP